MRTSELARAVKILRKNITGNRLAKDFILDRLYMKISGEFLMLVSHSITTACYQVVAMPDNEAEEQEFTVDSRDFCDVISSIKDKLLSLTIENQNLIIKAGDTQFELPIFSAEAFPVLPPIRENTMRFGMSSKLLVTILSKLYPLASTERCRKILMNVAMIFSENGVKFLATDGIRVGEINLYISHGAEDGAEIHIPLATCKLLISAIKESNTTQCLFTFKDGKCNIDVCGGVRIQFNYDNERFPNASKAFPQEVSPSLISFNRDKLLSACKRINSVFRRNEKRAYFRFFIRGANQYVKVENDLKTFGHVATEVQSCGFYKPCVGDSTIRLNTKFLASILKSIDSPEICLEFYGNKQPIVIYPYYSLIRKGVWTERYLLMPLRMES